jgi:hypothetical protein
MRARLFGDVFSRAGYPYLDGPAAGAGYVLRKGPKVKAAGLADPASAANKVPDSRALGAA